MTRDLPAAPIAGTRRLCACKGCPRLALFKPVLVLPPAQRIEALKQGVRPTFGEARLAFSVGICDRHKASMGLDDFLTDINWNKLEVKHARLKLAMPKRQDVKLEWEPLDEPK